MQNHTRSTLFFLTVLLLAGIANLLSRGFEPWLQLTSLMTALNYVLLTGLLLFWILSVSERLLPSAAKKSVLGAALVMLMYILLRIFRFRFVVEPMVMRYGGYAYWIPQMLIPAFFLMTCIRIRNRNRGRVGEALLLIPAVLLSLTVMTNDLHTLVYVPKIALADFILQNGTYSYGPVFYLLYIWMILTIAAGFVLLFRETGRVSKEAVRDLILVVALWFGSLILFILVEGRTSYRLFNLPEIHIFGMLGVFEVCIRYRLISHNKNYPGFFGVLRMPVLITDRDFHPAYRTETAPDADGEILKDALDASVELTGEQKLWGRTIRAGYAFWWEDESRIRRMQERLRDAGEVIAEENDLIRAETEQKERDAYLQSRHRIYHEIAEELYPVQKKIKQLLDRAEPGTDGFRDSIAEVSVLNAYVKRKTNLLLMASEQDSLTVGELGSALRESADALTLAGLQTGVNVPEDKPLPANRIVRLYDAFERIAEQLYGNASFLMVSWNGDGLRMAAETAVLPDLEGSARAFESDGVLYIDIPAEKEDTAP